MSLRVIHIFFISTAIILAAGFGLWSAYHHFVVKDLSGFRLGLGSFAVSIALTGYLVWFINKSRKADLR